MPTERIIGIDFGTSTSVVKVKTYKDGKPMDAPEFSDYVRFDGKSTLPSLVYYLEDGDILAGYDAENAVSGYGGELFRNFKLDLVSGDRDKQEQAVRLTRDFFKYIHSVYDDHMENFPPCDAETTYVSYPVKWPKEVCKMMVDIATEAGFKNVVGLDEPTAALYAVLIQKGDSLRAQGLIQQGKSVNMLMIDMGAGTTDLVLCKYTPGASKEVEILNTWPKADSDIMFGGREIDDKLCGYIKDYLVSCGLPDTDELIKTCLPQSKGWKEGNVSGILKKPDGAVEICGFANSFLMGPGIERKKFPPINREVFERLLEGYINQYPTLIHGCISNTEGVRPEDIDLVVLTGGHSQWYFAGEMLDGSITRYGAAGLPGVMSDSNRVVRLSLPQETVALGLVYQRLKVNMEPELSPTKRKQDEGQNIITELNILPKHEEWEVKSELSVENNKGILNKFWNGTKNATMVIYRRKKSEKAWDEYISLNAATIYYFPLCLLHRGWLFYNSLHNEHVTETFRTPIDLDKAVPEKLSLCIKSFKIVRDKMYVIAGSSLAAATSIYEYHPDTNQFITTSQLMECEFPDLKMSL